MLENQNTPLELTNDPSGNLAFTLGEHHFTIVAEPEGYRYTLYNQSYEKVEQDFNDQHDKTYGQVLEELLSMTKEHPIFENLEGLKQVDYATFMEMLPPPEQLAYQLDGGYFAIFESSEGYDYSFYDASYNQLDGGVYDDPTATIYEAIEEIAQDDLTVLSPQLGNYKDLPTVDFEDLTEEAEAVEMAQINQPKATILPIYEKAQFQCWVTEYQDLVTRLKNGDMIGYLNVEARIKYLLNNIQSSPMFEELKQNMPDRDIITENSDHIKVDGHMGTWYVADTEEINGKQYFLLEHEEYGDEAACVIVDGKGKLVLDDAWNGFDDLEYFLESQVVDTSMQAPENPPYKPPDFAVSIADAHAYGYTAEELLPMEKARARELFSEGFAIYALHPDNTEAMIFEDEEIMAHKGLFGIEKEDWTAYLELEVMKDYNRSVDHSFMPEVEPAIVGTIGYMNFHGVVYSQVDFTDMTQFLKTLKDDNYYGVPISVTVYRDDASKAAEPNWGEFFDPPPQSFKIVERTAPIAPNHLQTAEPSTMKQQERNASINRPISVEPTPPKEKQSVLERLQAKVPSQPKEKASTIKNRGEER